jgi:hypothetical protein
MPFLARRFPRAGRRPFPRASLSFSAHRVLYKVPAAVLGQHTAMADHPDTWARIIEMAHAQFPGNEPAD